MSAGCSVVEGAVAAGFRPDAFEAHPARKRHQTSHGNCGVGTGRRRLVIAVWRRLGGGDATTCGGTSTACAWLYGTWLGRNPATSTTSCPVALRAVPRCPLESGRLGGRKMVTSITLLRLRGSRNRNQNPDERGYSKTNTTFRSETILYSVANSDLVCSGRSETLNPNLSPTSSTR